MRRSVHEYVLGVVHGAGSLRQVSMLPKGSAPSLQTAVPTSRRYMFSIRLPVRGRISRCNEWLESKVLVAVYNAAIAGAALAEHIERSLVGVVCSCTSRQVR